MNKCEYGVKEMTNILVFDCGNYPQSVTRDKVGFYRHDVIYTILGKVIK